MIDIINILASFGIGAIVSKILIDKYERKHKRIEEKKRLYQELMIASNFMFEGIDDEERKEKKKKFRELYYLIYLDADDEVIVKLNKLLKAITEKNEENKEELYKDTMISIRKQFNGRSNINNFIFFK